MERELTRESTSWRNEAQESRAKLDTLTRYLFEACRVLESRSILDAVSPEIGITSESKRK